MLSVTLSGMSDVYSYHMICYMCVWEQRIKSDESEIQSYFSSSNANMVMQSTNVVKMIGNSWSYCPALLWVPLRAIFRWGETVKE